MQLNNGGKLDGRELSLSHVEKVAIYNIGSKCRGYPMVCFRLP